MTPEDKTLMDINVKLIEAKMEGFSKLINAHFENVYDRLEVIDKKVSITNGRVTELEKKEHAQALFCGAVQAAKKQNDKYRTLKYTGLILAVAILSAIIQEYGVLEFFKLVK